MNEAERQPILNSSNPLEKDHDNIQSNSLSLEKSHLDRDPNLLFSKLSPQEIKKFQNLFFLLSISVFLLLLIPQLFIFKYIVPSNKQTFFMKFGWTITIPVMTSIFSITYTWYNKEKIIKIEKYFAHVIFSIFLISMIQLTILVGLRYSDVLVSLILMVLNGNIFLLVINNIPACWDKPYSKFIAVTGYCLLHYVFHCIFFEKYFVTYFILVLISLIYFVYIIIGVKKLIMQLDEQNLLDQHTDNGNKVKDIRVLLYSWIILPFDILRLIMSI